MSGLFGLIFFVSIVALLIGWSNPKKVIFWGKEEDKTKKKLKSTYIPLMIISFIIFSATKPDKQTNQKKREEFTYSSSLDTVKAKPNKLSEEKDNNKPTKETKDTVINIPFAENVNVYDAYGKKVNIKAKTFYEIIEEKALGKIKYTYDIRLSNNKLTEDELRSLAQQLKARLDDDYDRIFICYYLPNDMVGNGAWATSHFDPDLRVSILGATENEVNKLKNIKTNKNETLIGQWVYESGDFLVVFYKKNGKIYTAYRDKKETTGETQMYTKRVNGKLRYIENGNKDEYFIINENGNLEIYDNMGFIVEYKRLQ